MKILILATFALILVLAHALPRPEELPPARISAAKINEEPKKDLEGSESAYIASPWVYPYWGVHYPYVIVG